MRKASLLFVALIAGCTATPKLMETGGPTVALLGAITYCVNNPDYCRPVQEAPKVELTRGLHAQLDRMNQRVNRSMAHVNDFASNDTWSHEAKSIGDCEDFALRKRKELMDAGWSSSNLLIVTGKTWRGIGHAALVVRTNKGNFVMDNLYNRIYPWGTSSNVWAKIQSPTNPAVWERIK